MKILFSLILAVATGPCFAAGLNKNLHVASTETYVRLYPMDGFMHIKEYALSATSSRTSVKKLKELVKNAKYSRKHFGFKTFIPMEESMTRDRNFITGEYRLMTRETNFITMMEDVFSGVLDRKVTVTVSDAIMLHFDGNDIKVRDNNAKGVYEKGKQRLIVWDKKNRYLEVVFGDSGKRKHKSFTKSFGADVSSPEISEAEILAWKNQPTTLMEKADAQYQHDADIFRLKHLEYYGKIITEFRRKTGSYPLQGKVEVQNYVHIAAPHQQDDIKGGPSQKHVVTTLEDFRRELEKGLGRKIDFKFDPQKAPVHAPNFYIYMIDGDKFYLAVHLYHQFPFSQEISNHYNKLEITNKETETHGIWRFEQLEKDADFKKALNQKPHKAGYFKGLEKKYR